MFKNKSFIIFIFLFPILFIHFLVIAIPSLSSLALSLTEWNGYGSIKFIGFNNFVELFDDRYFKKAVKHNFIWTILFLTIPIVVALYGAYLLTGIKRLQLFYRFIFFFPYILASIVNCLIWKNLFHPIHGLGSGIEKGSVFDFLISPLTNTSTSLYAVAWVDGWHFWGFLVVIYITAMYQIDGSLYEAAEIEGASKLQKFRFITFPMIRPTFIFTFIIIIIWSVPAFDYVYVLTGGGPAYSSEVIANYLYSQAFTKLNVGYASAIGCLMYIYVFIVLIFFGLLRRLGWEF